MNADREVGVRPRGVCRPPRRKRLAGRPVGGSGSAPPGEHARRNPRVLTDSPFPAEAVRNARVSPCPEETHARSVDAERESPLGRDPPLPEPSPAPAATLAGAGRSSCSCPHEVRRVVVGGKKREGRLAYLIQTGYAWGVPQREPKSFSFPFFSVTDESVLHRGQAPHATCVGKSLSLRTKALHARALVAPSPPSALMRPRVYEPAGA